MADENPSSMLVCPIDHSPLDAAEADLVARVNRAIAARRLINRAGQTVDRALDGGWVRGDGTLLYPIFDGIPVLLVDEAIPLSQIV